MELIFSLIASGAVATLITALSTYFQKKRESKFIEQQSVLDRFVADNNRLREEVSNIDSLKRELSNLKYKIILFEAARQDLPFPIWLKDNQGVMLSVNSTYERTFLVPKNITMRDYIGKKDVEVWGEEMSSIFRQEDQYVYEHEKPIATLFSVENRRYIVCKFVAYAGGVKIGVLGIALPDFYKLLNLDSFITFDMNPPPSNVN